MKRIPWKSKINQGGWSLGWSMDQGFPTINGQSFGRLGLSGHSFTNCGKCSSEICWKIVVRCRFENSPNKYLAQHYNTIVPPKISRTKITCFNNGGGFKLLLLTLKKCGRFPLVANIFLDGTFWNYRLVWMYHSQKSRRVILFIYLYIYIYIRIV